MPPSCQTEQLHVRGACRGRYRNLLVGASQFGVGAALGFGGWDFLHGAVVITVRAWLGKSWVMDGLGGEGKCRKCQNRARFFNLQLHVSIKC